jgi:hypothetical protein
MVRPYFKKRVHELEQIFAGAGGDFETLQTLRGELRHRKTARASALLRKVEAELGSGARREAPNPPRSAPREKEKTSPSDAEHRPHRVTPREPPVPPIRSALPDPETPDFSTSSPSFQPAGACPTAPDVDALLRAWTTLEVLEPKPMPKPEELKTSGRRKIGGEQEPEPWTDPGHRRRPGETAVFWFVYLGQLQLASAVRSLLDLFPDDSPEKPRPVRGTTPLAVVVLDEEGRPLGSKNFVSSFAWGYGRVRAGALQALAHFTEEERRLCDELAERLVRTDEEGGTLPTTAADLERSTLWLVGRFGLPREEVTLTPVHVRVPIRGRFFEPPEPELLNSFFLEDLDRVRRALVTGDAGAALRTYLTGHPPRPRRDAAREQAVLDEAIAPGRVPLARWPVRGRHPLVMMQQAAVNHAVRELEDSGIVGVNGPPGTGKTTLLRDVVAKAVLDRSIALAAFDDPQEAFSHQGAMSAGQGYLHLYRLHETLLGHEVVVASSNNKAVENISREIPALDAVADDFAPPLRYFASIADAVQHTGKRDQAIEEKVAWGLAAAVLGNTDNRNQFARSFWWDKQRSLQAYLRGIVDGWRGPTGGETGGSDEEDGPAEVLLLEDAPRDRTEALERWHDARSHFLEALQQSESRRKELEETRRALHVRASVEAGLTALRQELGNLRAAATAAATSTQEAETAVEEARRRARDAVSDREALQKIRPGFLARLFATRAHREWRERMAEKVTEVDRARSADRAAEEAFEAARTQERELQGRLREAEVRGENLEGRLAEIRAMLDRARTALGERLADRDFWSRPEAERQKLSPWLEESFQASRDDLFAACFELHRAFIGAAAKPLRHNLGAAMALLKGRKLSEKQEPARASLWASLFLAVPVISTTFASVARMFGPLGREQLGWLLIDEAGQAVPQAAVGAVWRSRRVIGIGDPMQIPPVVTLPQRLVDAILGEHGIDPDAWSAPRSSVQALADRASWFGTTLLHERGDVWVGSPLRVHRRCEEPMFGISNHIAYDGKMVQATPYAESAVGDLLGPSRWIPVEDECPGHWSPKEGELSAQLLGRLLEASPGVPDIFFITPFRIVQAELRRRLQRVLAEHAGIDAWRWVKENVGTIHTFQGKEAEAVVLVLGAPSEQAAGARYWAGGQPNLLNVAVSRAKRRLYVVGHRARWRDAGVFRTLDTLLP